MYLKKVKVVSDNFDVLGRVVGGEKYEEWMISQPHLL
jgi:hypothetical protein